MITAYFHIRLKQMLRAIASLGWIRILFMAGIVAFLIPGLFDQLSRKPHVYYVFVVFYAILLMVHLKRSDRLFLKTHFVNPKLICFTEYLVISSLLIPGLLIHHQWIAMAVILPAILIIVQVDRLPGARSLHSGLISKMVRFIPDGSFEWKSGIRSSFIFMALIWIIGMGTSFYIGSVPVALFIMGIMPLGFYEKGEPVQMLLAFEKEANGFLWYKIRTSLALFTAISLPLIAAFLVFHPGRWYIPVAEYILFLMLHSYFILTKYAFYEPNTKSGGLQVFGAIGTIGVIIPILLPIVWLLTIRFYLKSRKNLNFYLNDYH